MALARAWRAIFPFGSLANLRQWATRAIHEPDFEVFGHLNNDRGLCLDVGANRGYSAISILRHARRLRVISIEPNRVFRWALLVIAVLHPLRFRFHMFAAGRQPATRTLYLPGLTPTSYDALGSLSPEEFKKPHIHEQLLQAGVCVSGELVFRSVPVQVRPLDSLGLKPSLIKIDVEGYECQVLAGLTETISRGYPAIIIEMNHPDRWISSLRNMGYRFYFYEPATRSLRSFDATNTVQNLICLHERADSEITQKLHELVSSKAVLRLN